MRVWFSALCIAYIGAAAHAEPQQAAIIEPTVHVKPRVGQDAGVDVSTDEGGIGSRLPSRFSSTDEAAAGSSADDDGKSGRTGGNDLSHEALPSRFSLGSEPDSPAKEEAAASSSPAVLGALAEATVARQKYDVFRYEHAQRTFRQQHLTTWIIFFVVIILVFVGLWFSWQQFRLGLEQMRTAGPHRSVTRTSVEKHEAATETGSTPGGSTEKIGMTELEIGTDGVKISSPVVGVIILGLSLAFFYLYLKFVYPIVNLQ